MSLASDMLGLGYDLELAVRGGLGGSYSQGRLTAANTKTIASTDCMQVDLVRGVDEGLNEDRCAFVFKASAFTTGFSAENPVTPRAGDQYTPTGETKAWIIREAKLRAAGAWHRLEAARPRAGWDS